MLLLYFNKKCVLILILVLKESVKSDKSKDKCLVGSSHAKL